MAARLMGRSTGRVVRRKIRNMTARYRDRTDAKHARNAMPDVWGHPNGAFPASVAWVRTGCYNPERSTRER